MLGLSHFRSVQQRTWVSHRMAPLLSQLSKLYSLLLWGKRRLKLNRWASREAGEISDRKIRRSQNCLTKNLTFKFLLPFKSLKTCWRVFVDVVRVKVMILLAWCIRDLRKHSWQRMFFVPKLHDLFASLTRHVILGHSKHSLPLMLRKSLYTC